MPARALDAGVPAGGPRRTSSMAVTVDGARLQARELGHVLAVAKGHWVNIGGLHGVACGDHIAATLSRTAWNR